jgi:hypothetical protein
LIIEISSNTSTSPSAALASIWQGITTKLAVTQNPKKRQPES